MATAFSTDGSEIIQRSLEVNTVEKSSSENALLSSYEIPHCVDFIQKNSYQRVMQESNAGEQTGHLVFNWVYCLKILSFVLMFLDFLDPSVEKQVGS